MVQCNLRKPSRRVLASESRTETPSYFSNPNPICFMPAVADQSVLSLSCSNPNDEIQDPVAYVMTVTVSDEPITNVS